jgi:putative membrane protein (TIGR04086 family)
MGGVLCSLVLTLSAGIVIGLVLALSEWEGPTPLLLQIINYCSAVLGGALAGRMARKDGWLHGAMVGIIYTMAITLPAGRSGLVALLITPLRFRALAVFGAAIVGGMLGVSTAR